MRKIQRMKLEEMLTGIDFDVDVCDDYADDLYIAFCSPLALTDDGRKEFKDILDLEVIIDDEYPEACVLLSDKPNYEHLHRVLKDFLYSAAGYCSDSDWNKWFYYPDDDEYPDDVSEVGYNPYMGCYDDDC